MGSDDGESKPLLRRPAASTQQENMEYSAWGAFSVFIFPALGGLLFGYDIGGTSAVVVQLESSEYSGVTWYATIADSSFYQGVITSIGMFGAMIGSLICFAVADDLGRRRSLILASLLFLVGVIVEYISGDSTWDAATGISVLVTGRFIYGLGCGFAMHGAPAYIGEMAPPSIRGLLVSMKEVFIVLGMVLGYTIGYLYSNRSIYTTSKCTAFSVMVARLRNMSRS